MGKVCRQLHDQARVRGGGGGGVRVGSMEMGAKGAEAPPPPSKLMRYVTYILVKNTSSQNFQTPLHESIIEHEEVVNYKH